MTDRIERALKKAGRTDGNGVGEALRRLADRATTEGLVDVAYARADSPFGDLLLASTPRGLARVAFLSVAEEDEVADELAARISPRILRAPERLDDARRQLDEFFEGHRRRFELRTDRVLIHGFQRQVLSRTAQIPYGSYLTYAEVAAEAGSPRAHRAAGTALARNPIPIVIPCHRVLRSGGLVGNYGGGPEMKARLLEMEGAL